ncbi:uncharacterized protein STEHIDRAFT_122889 [Stereum hirsutum FP-91666 SS1]|uniref:uncharacterized protein n=1 Tax=Stereum hirsutum (strain FP-91666) TaxID=721885 RepID=UPI0004449230|nr:uncharacterized protein STEHIDRAFT_122889 [Stereum hirsutum FP-91666 SS1]EIM84970.1 hypothetical protein STEHIDRAFT_122889 [Stereum hirsutum FP-91666 SS1]
MSAAQEAELAEFATVVLNFDACRYVSAAGLVILLYDHLLTLDEEIQYVWKAPWTLPKGMFLANRYGVPLLTIINTWQLSGLANPSPTDTVCKVWIITALYAGVLSMANGGFIVLLRLWVLWNRRTSLVGWTLLVFVVTQLATFSVTTWVATGLVSRLEYSPLVNSCVLTKRLPLQGLWIPGVLFEIMVFSTTVYNAFDRPRDENRPMANQLYRDGFVFFCCIFTLRLINMVLAITAPLSLIFLGIFFIWCATNVTLSHLVLNVRRLAVERRSPEQDSVTTGYEPDTEVPDTPDDPNIISYELNVGYEEYHELR